MYVIYLNTALFSEGLSYTTVDVNISNSSSSSENWESYCRVERQLSFNIFVCDKLDTLDSFPNVSKRVAETISHLSVKNQPRLKSLKIQDLKSFTNLVTFTLTSSGLNFMESHQNSTAKTVFESSSKTLNFIDLRDNAFDTLNWRWFVGFKPGTVTLDVNNNPLHCSCSLFWLGNWYLFNQPQTFQSPSGKNFNLTTAKLVGFPLQIRDLDSLRCRDSVGDNKLVSLTQWIRTNTSSCSLPVVSVHPNTVYASQNETVSFSCIVQTGQQNIEDDKIFRPTIVVDRTATNREVVIESVTKTPHMHHMRAVISKVSSENMGWYVCLGKSNVGPAFDLAGLVVYTAPKISFVSASGERGKHIHFTFEIYGFPSANVTWLQNDVPISFEKLTPSSLTYLTFTYTNNEKFYYRTEVFNVKIMYNYPYYKGNYSLRACNVMGCDGILFAENINQSYFHEIPSRPIYQFLTSTSSSEQSTTAPSEILTKDNILLIIIITVCVSLVVTIFAINVICCLLKKRNYDKVSQQNRRDAKDLRTLLGASEAFPLESYSTNVVYQPVLSSDVPLIQRENVELIKEIGEGAFGKVYSAARLSSNANCSSSAATDIAEIEKTPVAVKLLKNVTMERSEEFAREAELMAKLNHPNIVTFYGVCLETTDNNNLLLLFEYMDLGDLKHFLAAHGPNPELIGAASGLEPLSIAQLLSIASQIASGLSYLHEKHFVHRDLACRNCLCQTPLTVKLSDFGMSRDIYSNDYYRLTKKAALPVRWLPPESLVYGKFTSHSDVWSYGVVLWEIFSYGITPWFQYSNMEVLQQVTAGAVMQQPEMCTDELYELMLSCWKKNPIERPSAQDICRQLERYRTPEGRIESENNTTLTQIAEGATNP